MENSLSHKQPKALEFQIPGGKPVLWIFDVMATKQELESYGVYPEVIILISGINPKYSEN
jgi:hypothetical protein